VVAVAFLAAMFAVAVVTFVATSAACRCCGCCNCRSCRVRLQWLIQLLQQATLLAKLTGVYLIYAFDENLLTLFVSSVASLQAQKFFSVLNWSNLQKYVFSSKSKNRKTFFRTKMTVVSRVCSNRCQCYKYIFILRRLSDSLTGGQW
jgi:hypothetical protein